MTNLRHNLCRAVPLVGLGVCLALTACSAEEEPVVTRAVAPPPPPPPSAPPVTPIEDLMANLGIDERVMLPENEAPGSDEEREALLEFFDAFVRADDRTIGEMLDPLDKMELEAMVASGSWSASVDGIEAVELETGTMMGVPVVLALFDIDGEYQPQLWSYDVTEYGAMFSAEPTPPNIIDRLSGDWIQSWQEILAEEAQLALQPDAEAAVVEEDDDATSSRSGSRSGGGGGTTTPGGGPGSPPGLRDPGPPQKPPGG